MALIDTGFSKRKTKRVDCTKVDALVVLDKPLEYDFLIGIDKIRELGGVVIKPTGDVQLGWKQELCAAIIIKEQDFCAVFDHEKTAWTAKWKWTRNKESDQLHNTIMEYTVFDKSRVAYETQLEMDS